MSWRGPALTAGVVVAAGLVLAPALLMAAVLTGSGSGESGGVACGDAVAASGDSLSSDELSEGQLRNAATVVAVGKQMRIPRQGIVVALAAASQESRFLNYANDGRGGDLRPDQAGIASSLDLPHQAVGTDHGSLGIFQQQWPWWGSMSELMDPATSASKFYARLVEVPGWESMPVTRAAQAVQRSAYPDAYADDEALAEGLLEGSDLSDGSGSEASMAEAAWTRWRRRLAVRCAGRGRRARHDADRRIGSRTRTSTTSATAAGTGRVATPAPTCPLPAVRRSAQRAPAPSSSSGTSPGRGRGSSR